MLKDSRFPLEEWKQSDSAKKAELINRYRPYLFEAVRKKFPCIQPQYVEFIGGSGKAKQVMDGNGDQNDG